MAAGGAGDEREWAMPSLAVLFVCMKNSVRSPMAESLARELLGGAVYTTSAGVEAGYPNGFVNATLHEIGLFPPAHTPQALGDLLEDNFDRIIVLAQPAMAAVAEWARFLPATIELWEVGDPTLAGGTRDQRLAAYRETRDRIAGLIRHRLLHGLAGVEHGPQMP